MLGRAACLCIVLAISGCSAYWPRLGEPPLDPSVAAAATEAPPVAAATDADIVEDPSIEQQEPAAPRPAKRRAAARRAAPSEAGSRSDAPRLRAEPEPMRVEIKQPSAGTLRRPPDTGDRRSTTPKVGSPEWERERAEDERKDRHLKQMIRGICRGC
jgi:hypothetical protein